LLISLAWQKARNKLGRAFKTLDCNNLNPDLPLKSSPFVLNTLHPMKKGGTNEARLGKCTVLKCNYLTGFGLGVERCTLNSALSAL
jgi:hypothetical protein